MVIGNGMIAKRFNAYAHRDEMLVFASGVSDSSCTQPDEYRREEELLLNSIKEYPGARVLYFSTCSIYDPSLQQSAYVQHKLQMEALIKKEAGAYTIFRVSNPVGITSNRHTVLNFFIDKIQQSAAFELWAYASRNLVDLDDMYLLCEATLQASSVNGITNIANPVNYPVITIVEAIEDYLGRKGNYTIVNKGNSPLIDTTAIQPLFEQLGIDFSHGYLQGLLQKYFPV